MGVYLAAESAPYALVQRSRN